jgi:hypothetical protein
MFIPAQMNADGGEAVYSWRHWSKSDRRRFRAQSVNMSIVGLEPRGLEPDLLNAIEDCSPAEPKASQVCEDHDRSDRDNRERLKPTFLPRLEFYRLAEESDENSARMKPVELRETSSWLGPFVLPRQAPQIEHFSAGLDFLL